MKQSCLSLILICASSVGWTQGAQPTNPDIKTTFLKDCAAVAPAISAHFLSVCKSLAKDKTDTDLADYDQALKEIGEDLKKWGPDVAKHVIAKCAAIATDKASTPRAMEFCLETSSVDVPNIAKGKEQSTQKIATLVGHVQADGSSGGPGWNSLSEKKKSEFRAAAVHGCAAEAPPYVAAVCAGIALHEDILTDKPYGSGGEVAKAFDGLMKGFTAAGNPQQKVNDSAKKALEGIGVPAAAIATPADINAAAVKAATQTAAVVTQAATSTKNEVNKRLGTHF